MDYKILIIDGILLVALIISLVTDLKYRLIKDKVTIPAMILGFTLNGVFFGLAGLKNSAIGFAVGFLLFIAFGMGGGDIKLMGAIGALKGWLFTLTSIMYIGVAGGLFAIIYLIWTGKFLKTLINTFNMVFKRSEFKKTEQQRVYLPYGPVIFVGVILTYLAINYKIFVLFKI